MIGVDINPTIVEHLNRGETHNPEPELSAKVRLAVKSHHLSAQTIPEEADTFIIAVPTPAASCC